MGARLKKLKASLEDKLPGYHVKMADEELKKAGVYESIRKTVRASTEAAHQRKMKK